jgi:hypothetical protein
LSLINVNDDLERMRHAADGAAAGKTLIIAGRCGRLANRLALFANFIAFAEERGHRVINFTFHSYASFFESTRGDIYCQYPAAARRSLWDVVPGAGEIIRGTRLFSHLGRLAAKANEWVPLLAPDTITVREGPGGYVALDGLEVEASISGARRIFFFGWTFRAPGCMERHAAKIRTYFTPVEKHGMAAREVTDRLRQNADVVVGLHIRGGDYRDWRGGKYSFTIERYAGWAREMGELFPGRKTSFLVCSDEPRDRSEFQGLSVGFGTGVPVQDLYALAGCDYILGPVSTFTQWASFYGNKPLFQFRSAGARLDLAQFQVSYVQEIPQ